jgi:hypothetical protein
MEVGSRIITCDLRSKPDFVCQIFVEKPPLKNLCAQDSLEIGLFRGI